MDNHALYNLLDDIVTLILLIYVLNWLNVRQQTFQGHYKRTISLSLSHHTNKTEVYPDFQYCYSETKLAPEQYCYSETLLSEDCYSEA